MTFSGFSPAVILVGCLALAALLFALHRLRVRREVVRVATSMFWRMAVQAAPPRILHERFRHILSYLLVLVIALALWLASAGPRQNAELSGARETFFLDASAGMTASGVFDAAARALIADASKVPAAQRSIRLGDGAGTVLLAPGENISLLPARLKGVRADAFPSPFADWASRLGLQNADTRVSTLRYYGLTAALRDAEQVVPKSVHVEAGYLAPEISGNRGIVALGASPAASGGWGKADVYIELLASDGAAPQADGLSFTVNGVPFSPTLIPLAPGRFLIRDMDADGAELAVSLDAGDGFAADDHAALRIPLRQRTRVTIAGGVPDPVRRVVAADPSLEIVPVRMAQVEIRTGSQVPEQPRLPALIIDDAANGGAAFQFAMPSGGDRQALRYAMDQLGLARLDAGALAGALHRPIGVDMGRSPVRQVAVWRDMFIKDVGFTDSPAMPLFVSGAVHWLANVQGWVPYARAGEPLSGLDQAAGLQSAGRGMIHDGSAVASPVLFSLTDRATTLGIAQASSDHETPTSPGGLPFDNLFIGLLLLAGVLLAIEWVLFQRGWMP